MSHSVHFEGLVQNYCNYLILYKKLQTFCTKPSKFYLLIGVQKATVLFNFYLFYFILILVFYYYNVQVHTREIVCKGLRQTNLVQKCMVMFYSNNKCSCVYALNYYLKYVIVQPSVTLGVKFYRKLCLN